MYLTHTPAYNRTCGLHCWAMARSNRNERNIDKGRRNVTSSPKRSMISAIPKEAVFTNTVWQANIRSIWSPQVVSVYDCYWLNYMDYYDSKTSLLQSWIYFVLIGVVHHKVKTHYIIALSVCGALKLCVRNTNLAHTPPKPPGEYNTTLITSEAHCSSVGNWIKMRRTEMKFKLLLQNAYWNKALH